MRDKSEASFDITGSDGYTSLGRAGGWEGSLLPWLDVGTREEQNATLVPPSVCFAV